MELRGRKLCVNSKCPHTITSMISTHYVVPFASKMESDGSAAETRRGRKRLRHEEKWQRKSRMLDKDQGRSYVTYKGKEVPAKTKPASLSCRCAYRCSEKVSKVKRARIFEDFYKLKSVMPRTNIYMG